MNTMTPMAVALAGWMNRQQQDVIEYLREEVRVLKELQGKRRLRIPSLLAGPAVGVLSLDWLWRELPGRSL